MVKRFLLLGLAGAMIGIFVPGAQASDPVETKTLTPPTAQSSHQLSGDGFTFSISGKGSRSTSLVVGWLHIVASLVATASGTEQIMYTNSDPASGHTKFFSTIVTAVSASAGFKVTPSIITDVKTNMTYQVLRTVDGVQQVVLSGDITNQQPVDPWKFKFNFKTDIKFNFANVYFTQNATQTVVTSCTSTAQVDTLGFFGTTGGTCIGMMFSF